MAGLSVAQLFVLTCFILIALPKAEAFGAGNIASISKIEGKNWRHGDIEDVLKLVACIKGHKWSSMMIKRVYFGNWLRDYSQAVDVGTLKGVQAGAIRVLVWILSFMAFGYATGEFEVTEERLGVYRPEEHIDNPEDLYDNIDGRQYDPRLRPPVQAVELQLDPETGMKNYIANERGDWATSAGYIRHSFNRSIHFGRTYTSGGNAKGREEDLCEALRCLGQGLHCVEDFGAHTNYVELVLREMGYHDVFPHTGVSTGINLGGRQTFPLVTGTFGGVDFLHSVLGEVTDHVSQSEVDQLNKEMGEQSRSQSGGGGTDFISLLGKVPGFGAYCQEAQSLEQSSRQQAAYNQSRGLGDDSSRGFDSAGERGSGYETQGYQAYNPNPPPPYVPDDPQELPGSSTFPNQPSQSTPQVPPHPVTPSAGGNASTASAGTTQPSNVPEALSQANLEATVKKIYPILQFRDRVMKGLDSVISHIPGLEKLIDTISERISLFIMGLLAPYVQPIIAAASKQLKTGSTAVVDSSAKHQYLPWTDPHCTAPTHSLLSKDHFSNILNEPAGAVAAEILKYVAPRIIYAWDHPGVPVDQVLDDVVRVFHHPCLRDRRNDAHNNMWSAVERWVRSRPGGGKDLNHLLSSQSVKDGKNHITTQSQGFPPDMLAGGGGHGHSHGPVAYQSQGGGGGSGFPGLPNISVPGLGNLGQMGQRFSQFSNMLGGSSGGGEGGFLGLGRRGLDEGPENHGHGEGYGYGSHTPQPGYEGYQAPAPQETYGQHQAGYPGEGSGQVGWGEGPSGSGSGGFGQHQGQSGGSANQFGFGGYDAGGGYR